MYKAIKALKDATNLPVRAMVLLLIVLFISTIYLFSNTLVHRSKDFTTPSTLINITTSSIPVSAQNVSTLNESFQINNTENCHKDSNIMNKTKNTFSQTTKHKAICNHLLPKTIWSIVHHKTGHDFSWSLGGALKNYCRDHQARITTEFSINKFLLHCKPHNCVYLHWVRHPLNTIISGFYYHLKTDEEWVHLWTIQTSINTALNMDTDTLLFDVLNGTVDSHHFYSKYRKEVVFRASGSYQQRMAQRRVKGPKLIHCFDVGKSSLFDEYIREFVDTFINNNTEYVLNSDITLQAFYNKLNSLDYKIGLFWEFVRYTKCEWASIYVLQQIGDKHFENVVQYDIDNLIHGKFDENMNKLLDQLNVVDNDNNKQKVKSDVNITQERTRILSKLKQLDVSEINKTGSNHQKMHVTYNQYHLEQVIHDLLSLDPGICKLIKTMTLLLKFEWEYDKHC